MRDTKCRLAPKTLAANQHLKTFGGSVKYRETRLGTILYFSSEDELRDLFEQYIKIKELKTTGNRGGPAPHLANYAFMERGKVEQSGNRVFQFGRRIA